MARLPTGRVRLLLAGLATLALTVPVAWMWWTSLLPDSYDLAEMGYADYGGGPQGGHDHHEVAVADLVADPERRPDVRETLTVRREEGLITVNGTSPGPVLRVTVGDLVEVRLVNEDIADGATLHWHGVDVPNAADGVAGVTQDAVLPGEDFVYRFVADRVGTYWYHSHQVSHEQVRQGLLGALVVEERRPGPGVDHVAVVHRYGTTSTVNGVDGVETLEAREGDEVRLRVVNTDNGLRPVWVTGAAYRVLAVDGADVNGPTEVDGEAVRLPAGGRVDLGFVVPEGGVRVDFGSGAGLEVGDAAPDPESAPKEFVDLLAYGQPTDVGLDTDDPDRSFRYEIGRRPGFLDGVPGMWWTINGGIYPDVPMYMVAQGDVVVFEIENGSSEAHPMHLHGHHAVVLARDGQEATGSPWWVDSLEVGPGETFRIAFLADNPGLWMDHCHNLPHATEGLVAHLMYAGVASSYLVGGDHGNEPE